MSYNLYITNSIFIHHTYVHTSMCLCIYCSFFFFTKKNSLFGRVELYYMYVVCGEKIEAKVLIFSFVMLWMMMMAPEFDFY